MVLKVAGLPEVSILAADSTLLITGHHSHLTRFREVREVTPENQVAPTREYALVLRAAIHIRDIALPDIS